MYNYGAVHIASGASPLLKELSRVLSVAALLPGILVAWRAANRSNVQALAAIMFSTVALLLVTGTVLSPQYMLWLIGLGSAVACARGTILRRPVLLILPAALLTQVLYPFLASQLIWGYLSAVLVLTARNAVLLLIAGWSLLATWRALRVPMSVT